MKKYIYIFVIALLVCQIYVYICPMAAEHGINMLFATIATSACLFLFFLIGKFKKDGRNLAIYLTTITVFQLILFPIIKGVFILMCIGAGRHGADPDNNPEICIWFFSLIGLMVLCHIIPIVITILAIIKKWSKYLDWFFNQMMWPTIILMFDLTIFAYLLEPGIPYQSDYFNIACTILYFAAISYWLVYPIIVVNNIIRWIKAKKDNAKRSS